MPKKTNTAATEEKAAEEAVAAPETSEAAEPDIDSMSDEEFENYLRSASEAEPTGEAGNDTAAAYADEATAEAAGPETEDAAEDAAEAEAIGDTPYKTFATEDDFNAALEQYVTDNYGERLRRGDEAAALNERLSQTASRFYDDGEEDPLNRLTGDLEAQTAQRSGQTPEEFRAAEADRRDLEAYRSQQKAQQDIEAGRQQILDRWNAETERLRQNVPDFDLDTAMQNPEFREMVVGGASIDGAYYAVKYNELQSQQAAQAQEPLRRSIPQNAQQTGTKPGSSVNDMMSMSDGDFRKRLKSIMNNG